MAREKRYHQSPKSRLSESRGMEKKLRGPVKHAGFYEGHDSRRRLEHEDSMMIREDHNEIANLPQHVVMRPYPKTGYYEDSYLDDTARGIDHQIDQDMKEKKMHMHPEKY